MKLRAGLLYLLLLIVLGWACQKNSPAADDNQETTPAPPDDVVDTTDSVIITPPTTYALSYGDSVFYLKNNTEDYIINPVEPKTGQYSSFPDGLELNEVTGAINVSKSETGLRYRVSYISAANDTSSTIITLSGINYLDQFYILSNGDSIAYPIYNGNLSQALPCNNGDCSFDEDNAVNGSGCSLKTINGQINLAETVRNGLFGKTPKNNERSEVPLKYRLNDKSNRALNQLRIKLYYYETMDDVADDLKETLKEREGALLGINSPALSTNTTIGQNGRPLSQGFITGASGTTSIKQVARPRPPCIIVIGRSL
jgi:hypothetical protein